MRITTINIICVAVISSIVMPCLGQNKMHSPIAIGSASLRDGICEIAVEELPEEYQVVLTPSGQTGFLYVDHKGTRSFTVKVMKVGDFEDKNASFDYVVYAPVEKIEKTRLVSPIGEMQNHETNQETQRAFSESQEAENSVVPKNERTRRAVLQPAQEKQINTEQSSSQEKQ